LGISEEYQKTVTDTMNNYIVKYRAISGC